MKLWEKNFILMLGISYLILFGGIFAVLQMSFRQNLEQESQRILESQELCGLMASNMLEREDGRLHIAQYCMNLAKRGRYLSVCAEGQSIANLLPFSSQTSGQILTRLQNETPVLFVQNGTDRYLCIYRKTNNLDIVYGEKITPVYTSHKRNQALFLVAALAIALLLAIILYCSLKKIYRPVNNIAHELRTPLTAIQGYAQYILLGKITPEDVAYASAQIDKEAKYIGDLVERLLIIGHLKSQKIMMEQIPADVLRQFVSLRFPAVQVSISTDSLYGDRTLLESLLANLLSNAARYGHGTTLSLAENSIRIYNDGDFLDKRKLRILNGNHSIPQDMADGKGLGVPLCHEIARLHHGSLKYQNTGQGVEVIVHFGHR